MQEDTVQWDPTTIHVHIPWYVRLYVLYLVLVLAVTFIRSARLAFLLWRRPIGKRLSGDALLDEKLPADSLASSLMCGDTAEAMESRTRAVDSGLPEGISLRRLAAVEAAFKYSWRRCYDSVEAMKRFARLTALVALLVTIYGQSWMFRELAVNKVASAGALGAGWSELFAQLAMGLFICVVLYGLAVLFENSLANRRTKWEHFLALSSLTRK